MPRTPRRFPGKATHSARQRLVGSVIPWENGRRNGCLPMTASPYATRNTPMASRHGCFSSMWPASISTPLPSRARPPPRRLSQRSRWSFWCKPVPVMHVWLVRYTGVWAVTVVSLPLFLPPISRPKRGAPFLLLEVAPGAVGRLFARVGGVQGTGAAGTNSGE
ncbi:hypothetical protein G7046_g1750 [Stylonectria norvegica]|nr:hypothetical protein G7046_g1750 [Stylonectria norvegica]